jgi:hypothetical protein
MGILGRIAELDQRLNRIGEQVTRSDHLLVYLVKLLD